MNSVQRWAEWLKVIYTRGGIHADNGIKIGERQFYLGVPKMMKNGALQGQAYEHVAGRGMVELGMFKIGADGEVQALPQELAEAFGEPLLRFRVTREGVDGGIDVTDGVAADELLRANGEDAGLVAWLRRGPAVAEEFVAGGGAAPLVTTLRTS